MRQLRRAGDAVSLRPAPLVTVITPARDMAAFLGETMASVLGQSFGDLEYLVVDNGSSDDTRRIAEAFAARDDRVRVLDEDRPGSAAARNRGLAVARGEYLAFVDADDVWLPAKLAVQVAQLQSLPAAYCGVFCRSVCTDEAGGVLHTYRPPAGTYDLRALRAWFYPVGNGSSFLVRRDAAGRAGGFDEGLTNLVDVEWVLRLVRDGGAPLLLGTAQALVRYRQRPGSVSTEVPARMRALETVVNRFDDDGDPLVWMRPALMAYRLGRDAEGRRWAARAGAYGWHRLLTCADGRRLAAFHARDRLRRTAAVDLRDDVVPPS